MKNYVITIARGYGSGGRQIGMQLAGELGIQFIDKELLKLASIESGINEALFSLADERIKKNLFKQSKKNSVGFLLTPEDEAFLSDENLFNYQARILRLLSLSESYVVMGRAADYILKDNKNVVSVNIQAPFEDCVKSIMMRAGVEEKQAIKAIRTTDKCRADYYKFYTGNDWNDVTNYDMTLNSKKVGREKCVEVIKSYTKLKLGIEIEG